MWHLCFIETTSYLVSNLKKVRILFKINCFKMYTYIAYKTHVFSYLHNVLPYNCYVEYNTCNYLLYLMIPSRCRAWHVWADVSLALTDHYALRLVSVNIPTQNNNSQIFTEMCFWLNTKLNVLNYDRLFSFFSNIAM